MEMNTELVKTESNKLVNKFERTLAQSFVDIPEQQASASSPERGGTEEEDTQQ